MDELPNNVIVLIPTVRMLAWINELEEEQFELSELLVDPTAVVVPELDTKQDLESFLEAHWRELFEVELESWSSKETWPNPLTYELFRNFLEIKLSSMVYLIGGEQANLNLN